ncbi:DUF6327 family protein [Zunongwangia atlantica]|uniref:Glutaminyl-tRNA synthetase n=1 Tax=Zunongwangia atlantica 22II14-10F7 TaxID=1185767 RepID=A0A1Y1T3A2_9FLAO|nr:DUF6327 family protein [Zunongwangia atlantica]ORL45222.1 glutaminyl-tRNA synthetase [Zunongwangia atlantica 22II14-10F7]
MKQYSSFEEIDRDLKILKLQTQIDKEEIKLTIEEVKDSLSPIRVVGNAVGAIMQKAIVLKAVAKIFGVKRVVTSSK